MRLNIAVAPSDLTFATADAVNRYDNEPAQINGETFVAFDKGDFIGREATLRERETGARESLVLLELDATDADAAQDDGIWFEGRCVGAVTSGAYGHYVGKSLALAYLREPGAAALPGPARGRDAEPSEVTE